MSLLNASPLLAAAGGEYQISRSVRLRSSASAYLNRVISSTGNQRTLTLSAWVKRGALGASLFNLLGNGAGSVDYIGFNSDSLRVSFAGGTSAVQTTAVYRDPSSWYHVVVAIDTTQATAANRVLVWVNGVAVTAFSTASYPSQNATTSYNTSGTGMLLGQVASGNYFDGYLTEVNFIDGQALTPSSFGETDAITGVWKPKKYAGTYGTNGFYLNFADNSSNTAATIGKDSSGNGNNWTPNNISVTAGATYDSMIDTPTPYADGGNGRGNYAVLNPLDSYSSITLSNANLNLSVSTDDAHILGTIGMTSGKWYWEYGATSGTYGAGGVAIGSTNKSTFTGGDAGSWSYAWNGSKYNAGTGTAYGATFGAGDIIGVAFDADAGTLTFYKNNTSQGTAFTGLTNGPYFPTVGDYTMVGFINFGQRPFAYTPPTGFKALNTQNLPESTVARGNRHFDVSLYTGNGSTQSVVNAGGFQPDFVWVKARSSSQIHMLQDAVRGAGTLKELVSNSVAAEGASSAGFYGNISAFNSSGFSVATGSLNAAYVNLSGETYVGWQWKASGSTVSNTAGSITSTVSANPTAGFSVVTYTGNGTSGATIGHGLGVAPRMIIVKRRNSTGEWLTYTQMTGNTNFLELNTTAASFASITAWNNTTPTSNVFTVGNATGCNASGSTYVAYCFAPVAGYSAFGSYTGNGSTDGPFVYLGFRPKFVMIKVTNNTYDWEVADSSRSPTNFVDDFLVPNSSAAENANVGAANSIDFLSNGFKIRANWTRLNDASGTFIYMAFAENPFKNALAR